MINMQILNNYKKWNPILLLYKGNFWDFIISKKNIKKTKTELISFLDFNNVENDDLLKTKNDFIWEFSKCDNLKLSNIGFTGIDNGFVNFDINKITNQNFLDILKKSCYTLNENFNLLLKKIKSNTKTYSFESEIIEENDEKYLKLNGGFYQGFFKSSNNYQVLPNTLNGEWILDFNIRPRNYVIEENTLNSLYPNNKGIFFYIGARSENKFLNDYSYDFSIFRKRENVEYYDCEMKNEYVSNDYFTDDFIVNDIEINNNEITLDNNVNITENGYFEIETDNKYLFFNNTDEGYNTDTWDENNKIVLTGTTKKNTNMYLYLNNTKNGYTTDNINTITKNENKDAYKKIVKDIINNAIAFKINDNGSIGYRYIVENGENDYEIIEEYSHENIIKFDEWNQVKVILRNITPSYNMCENSYQNRKMKILIYVNNYLKFVSKELPLLNLRELNEHKNKQEGVPFNISIGGGTMGLCDSISWDYNKPFKYILPLEENFGGTFIGDIKWFKFYL